MKKRKADMKNKIRKYKTQGIGIPQEKKLLNIKWQEIFQN
jgi:hypothetical protein